MTQPREIMKQCYNNASEELKALYDQGLASFYTTNNLILNYMDTLEGDGTSEAHKNLVNGVKRFTFRGLPIYDMLIGSTISSDFGNAEPF